MCAYLRGSRGLLHYCKVTGGVNVDNSRGVGEWKLTEPRLHPALTSV